MAGGPLNPNSVALSPTLSQTVYVPLTNTNLMGELESYSVPCGSPVNGTMSLKFDMPEVIPSGVPKLRLLSEANATVGVVNLQVSDVATNAAVNLGTLSLVTETATVVTYTAADTLIDTKVSLAAVPTSNQLLLVVVTFLPTSTLAQKSAWQPTLVFE